MGFDVWARVVFVELPTASGPKSERVYCGYRPGPTRVSPTSRQDDENVSAPALSRAVCVVVQVVAVGRVRWWSFYHQLGPHPSSTDSCGEGVGRPRRLHLSARARCCTAVVAAVALEAGSALRGDSWRSRIDGLSPFHAESLVTVRSVKYVVSSLTDFVSERLHCHLVLCACWHDGSKVYVLVTPRATLWKPSCFLGVNRSPL